MSKPITLYEAKTPILSYYTALGELYVVKLKDTDKGSIKSAISKIMGIPKKAIKIKNNLAIANDFERQMQFELGYIKNI